MTEAISKNLDEIYIQSLETDIIRYLSSERGIDIRKAMDVYYGSDVCAAIHDGLYDIQYLDYKYLAEEICIEMNRAS